MIAKIFIAAAVAATLATASVATSSPAAADSRDDALAVGLIGGLILGAVIAGEAEERPVAPRRYYNHDAEPHFVSVRQCRRVLVEDDWGDTYWKRICR